ncbi:MAG: hypothetical protein RR748_08660 [Pseudomonas sp.]
MRSKPVARERAPLATGFLLDVNSMTTVFIAGSINIKNLDPKVKERINNIVASDFEVVVGDAGGADTSIEEYLLSLVRSRTHGVLQFNAAE